MNIGKRIFCVWVIVAIVLPISLFAQDSRFAVAVNYGAGHNPLSLFACDLDGDGDSDLAVANSGAGNFSGSVSVLMNNGDGTFQSTVDYGVGNYPSSIFASDLDGDGDNDLAVTSYADGLISVLKNNGNGTFQAYSYCQVEGYPWSVYVCDLDGNGTNDLAVALWYPNRLCILLNNGNGTFQQAVYYGAADCPYSVFASDLDGDGDIDLAVGNEGSANVSILLNIGNMSFQPKVNYAAGDTPRSIFAADLDGDGDNDLAVANYGSDNLSILRNNGNGTFQTAVNYPVGDCPSSVFACDLDGDGDNDLVVGNTASQNISVLMNLSIDLSTFHLISPLDEAIVNRGEIIWFSSSTTNTNHEISYKLFWDEDSTFGSPDSSSEFTDTVFILPNSLDRSHSYFWHIRAQGDSGNYRFSLETWSFYLDGYPTSPTILNPTNGAHIDTAASLNWLTATDPDSFDVVTYSVQIDDDSLFSSPEVYDTVTTGLILDNAVSIEIRQLAGYQSLQSNHLYYWRVRADDHYGLSSAWPESLHYFVYLPQNHPPEPFALLLPLSGIRRVDYNTYFKWNSTADYDPLSNFNYYFQYSGDSLFNDLVITLLRGRDTSLTLPTNSLGIFGNRIYWRVLAIDNDSLIRIGGIPEQFREITIVTPGDANGDGSILGSDVIFLVRTFKGIGNTPDPLLSGDANADCHLRGSDVVYLVSYLKGYCRPPIRGNCEPPPVPILTKPKTE